VFFLVANKQIACYWHPHLKIYRFNGDNGSHSCAKVVIFTWDFAVAWIQLLVIFLNRDNFYWFKKLNVLQSGIFMPCINNSNILTLIKLTNAVFMLNFKKQNRLVIRNKVGNQILSSLHTLASENINLFLAYNQCT